ncbi:MAG: M24 family metallopeptidase [Thermoanaerobaculia bacterium]
MILARSSRDPYLAPFVGPVRLGESFLVMPRGGPPRLGYMSPMERVEAAASGLDLLTPEALDVERWQRDGAPPSKVLGDVLSRALHLCELAPGTVALAGCVEAGKVQGACTLLEMEGWSFAPGEDAVAALRRHKTPEQLDALRRTAAGTVAAFRHVAALLAAAKDVRGELWLTGEPLTVARLRREIAVELMRHGLEEPDGNIVAPAEEGAIPHTVGSGERVLRSGESLVVDLFPREAAPWGTLFADCTRTFCVGEPLADLVTAHARVREALALAAEKARPGVRGWNVQEAVCEHFAGAGYATQISNRETTHGYVHGLGHGVGFELHEAPSFKEWAEDDDGRLAAGDVFTLEPGLYDPGAGWAVRLEDLVVLGEDGVENLTSLPYDLDPRAW